MGKKIGKPLKFHTRFKFLVEIDGLGDSRFAKCSELSAEIAKIEQWQGGAIKARKTPGRVTFSDVTLERGATESREMWDWFKTVANAQADAGLPDGEYERNGDIVQLDRDNKTLRRWSLTEAWPTKFIAGDWDNTADENVVESVTLTYNDFDLKQ